MSAAAELRPGFEVVIGLEVHVQLRTASKLFSPAPITYGEDPNHGVHPICLALPGVLPVLNARAVELGIRAALATHCTVHPRSVFARKNYFYPDLPKGYQISQYEDPLATGGWLDVVVEEPSGATLTRRVGLTRIHMEEDAGKSIHDAAVAGSDATHVDLNRAGVPLLEIVSEPDLRSPAEAGAYLRALRQVLRYVDVSDADMEKGHFRCDANVSLRRPGDELGTRTELKNLNSFRFVEEAIEAEVARQAEVLEEGGRVVQATMAYDPVSGRTRVLRLKENADDYRYFPDPDLVPLVIDPQRIEDARRALPELADAKRARFQAEHGLSDYDATLLTESRALSEFFEAAAGKAPAKAVANWILRDLLRALSDQEREIDTCALGPDALARLVTMVEEGRTTAQSARGLLPELVERGGDPEALVRERGLEAVSDTGVLEAAVDEALAASPENVEQYRAGEKKVLNFFMGQVMKRTQGKADPAAVRKILQQKLDS
ncbi:MAG: Asp-tRNA(Asn)/Glu-tRNA(Gln) amidotransferase subunit GatB [Myxococcota bacterium]|nr:Asp-tRNA(Asn)/Glu-tRNA(Gln) amidotransferase subunit GatB [Myxococcota bacterium]